VPDGVFVQLNTDGPVQFHALTRPSDRAIRGVALDACRRVCNALEAKRHWQWVSDKSSSTVIEGLLTFGDRTAQSAKFFAQAARHAEGGVAPQDGAYAFHVNADHVVEAGDRGALVVLVEYVLAPPVTDEQLSVDEQGNIVIRMKRARHDRTEVEVVAPFAFLDRLAALVPRPRSNAIRYLGVYAPNATNRSQVVPWRGAGTQSGEVRAPDGDEVSERQAQAVLKAKHHGPESLVCTQCRIGRLQVVEVVTPRFRYRKPGWIPPDQQPASRVQDRIGQDLVIG
jgi:hypothetical protein